MIVCLKCALYVNTYQCRFHRKFEPPIDANDTFSDLEFKRLFPLFWGQQGDIFLFVLCVSFCTHEQLTISFKYSRDRTYFCTFHLSEHFCTFHRSEHKLHD